MSMFIPILDRATNEVLNVDVTQIRTYSEQTIVDRQGTSHLLITYALISNRYIEEEFATIADRDEKLELLEQYNY